MSQSSPRRRVVVFTATRYPGGLNTTSAVECIEAIAEAFPDWEFAVVHQRPERPRRTALRTRLRRLVRHPISYPLEVFRGPAAGPRPGRRGPVGLPATLREIRQRNVSYHRCESLHSEETGRLVAALEPWLGICIDAPILERALFARPRLGTIGIHKGLLPRYRGLPPGFWELAEGARATGVTIHWVDDGLDTGPIILQESLTIPPYATPAGLAAELDLLGSRVLVEALRRIDTGVAAATPQGRGPSRVYRRPDRRTARRVRGRQLRRRPYPGGPAHQLRRLVKRLCCLAFVSALAPPRNLVRGRRGRCRVTVLLFHRVSDSYHDSITVGVEQFRDFLRLLKRRYDVLDLPEFLASRGAPRDRPAVVLTFDDGYEDNHLAALLLRRAGLPCTFFVSTRIVGDGTRAFPHDLVNLGHRVPALSWDQVRRMVGWRFHVGNHTAHHVNLAEVPPDEAVRDVALAIEDLGRELGQDAAGRRWLAYPYGKAGDISAEVRGRLPGLGISHCFSAHGGSNAPDFDVLDINRQNIDCNFDALRLLAAIEGLAVRAGDVEGRHGTDGPLRRSPPP